MSSAEGKFPLHRAAKDGEVNVVKDLLAKGADKDEKPTKESLLSWKQSLQTT